MPELPEVEIAARNLRRWVVGGTIASAWFEAGHVARGGDHAALQAAAGATIDAVERRGKWLRIALSPGGASLFSHLGMTGRWLLRGGDDAPTRFERARLDVATRARIASARYDDPRGLGRFALRAACEPFAPWSTMGPDPLLDGLDGRVLAKGIGASRRAVHAALLDPTVVAGVGNIQATEGLFRACVHPAREAASLGAGELERVAREVVESIEQTLARDEGPEPVYVSAGAANPFAVYGRAGEPCPRCGTRLAATKIAGRTATFCSRCQPMTAGGSRGRARGSIARR